MATDRELEFVNEALDYLSLYDNKGATDVIDGKEIDAVQKKNGAMDEPAEDELADEEQTIDPKAVKKVEDIVNEAKDF